MSRRSGASAIDKATKLRSDIEDLKSSAKSVESSDVISSPASHEFDKLTSVEQSAASLGVNPDSWKPIAFLNNAHYAQLTAANMLDDTLARRIEAFRVVASPSGVSA
jgi:hypothetical protein